MGDPSVKPGLCRTLVWREVFFVAAEEELLYRRVTESNGYPAGDESEESPR